jgi:hypothetical protein
MTIVGVGLDIMYHCATRGSAKEISIIVKKMYNVKPNNNVLPPYASNKLLTLLITLRICAILLPDGKCNEFSYLNSSP